MKDDKVGQSVEHQAIGDQEKRESLIMAFTQQLPPEFQDKSARFFTRPSQTTDGFFGSRIYQEFETKEFLLSQRARNHLVRPSGRLSAPLAAMLHYPSFVCASETVEFGQTADDTNPCLLLLFKKGLNSQNLFWFEYTFRREISTGKRSHTKSYPKELLECHSSFSYACETACTAKVLIVFGSQNRDRVQARVNMRTFNVQNEGKNVQVSLQMDGNMIERVVVYVPHPHLWRMERDMMHVSISQRFLLGLAMSIIHFFTGERLISSVMELLMV